MKTLLGDQTSSLNSILNEAILLAELANDDDEKTLFEAHLGGLNDQEAKNLLETNPRAYRAFFSDRLKRDGKLSLTGSVGSLVASIKSFERDIEDDLANLQKAKEAYNLFTNTTNQIRLQTATLMVGTRRTGKAEIEVILERIRNRVAGFVRTHEKQLLDSATGTTRLGENIDTKRVFIVHGRDNLAKLEVSSFLTNLGLEPVILHQRPNEGNTLIEKIERNSNVRFAVILLTPDDVGSLDSEERNLRPRPRQNVVFEFGYFIALLRRANVCALVKGNIEKPSDIDGLVYVDMSGDGWKLDLAREMRAAGLDFDMNRLH